VSVTVRVTVNVPIVEKVWFTFSPNASAPSPKSHWYVAPDPSIENIAPPVKST